MSGKREIVCAQWRTKHIKVAQAYLRSPRAEEWYSLTGQKPPWPLFDLWAGWANYVGIPSEDVANGDFTPTEIMNRLRAMKGKERRELKHARKIGLLKQGAVNNVKASNALPDESHKPESNPKHASRGKGLVSPDFAAIQEAHDAAIECNAAAVAVVLAIHRAEIQPLSVALASIREGLDRISKAADRWDEIATPHLLKWLRLYRPSELDPAKLGWKFHTFHEACHFISKRYIVVGKSFERWADKYESLEHLVLRRLRDLPDWPHTDFALAVEREWAEAERARLAQVGSIDVTSSASLRDSPAETDGHDSQRWLRVSEAAAITGNNGGTITRAINQGKLKGNGKRGRGRRVDGLDLNRWQLERSGRLDPQESDAKVRKLLRNK